MQLRCMCSTGMIKSRHQDYKLEKQHSIFERLFDMCQSPQTCVRKRFNIKELLREIKDMENKHKNSSLQKCSYSEQAHKWSCPYSSSS